MIEFIWDLLVGSPYKQEVIYAMIGPLLGGLIGGIGGAVAGGEDRKQRQESTVDLGPDSDFLKILQARMPGYFDDLHGLVRRGPGEQDISNSVDASRGYAELLKAFSANGGLPSSADISGANSSMAEIFRPQHLALDQQFDKDLLDTNQMAARLGRSVNDPILQAKLRSGYANSRSMLGANQASAAGSLALQLGDRRIGAARERVSVLGGLANSALQNRLSLLGLGSNLRDAERSWQFNTAKKTTTGIQEGSTGQAILGGLMGFGAGTKIGQQAQQSIFGGGDQGGGGGGGGSGGGGMGFGVPDLGSSMPAFSSGAMKIFTGGLG